MTPGEPTRTVIATDVRLYAEGLEQALQPHIQIEVVALAGEAGEAMASLREHHPDILLLDPAMPDAQMLARALFESTLRTKVLVLGLAETESEVISWASEGISGFVTRQNSLDQLVTTIERVANNAWTSSPKVMSALLRHLAQLAHGRSYGEKSAHLTRREYDVAHLLAHGLANKEIARELGISVPTAKNHVHNILAKLRLRSRAEAAAWMRAHAMPRHRGSTRRKPAGS
jgi:DNA-binding NarL/FixJ family response regulator